MDAPKGRGYRKKALKNLPPLDLDAVFEGRDRNSYGTGEAPASRVVDEYGNTVYDYTTGEPVQSSYPHLTYEEGDRAEHVTSSRIVRVPVAANDPYVIHQRFHQNTDGKSEPMHDRFFAVNQETGVFHTVRVDFDEKEHLGKGEKLPGRGDPIGAAVASLPKIVFIVGEENDKHPPLSPRSIRRELPNSGYPRREPT